MPRTIEDLIALVPQGDARTFKAAVPLAGWGRFVEVTYNWDCGDPVAWHNRPAFEMLPWSGSREKRRIGLASLEQPNLTYDGDIRHLADFYSVASGDPYVISEQLLAVIDAMDPQSLEVRPVIVQGRDGAADMNMVMSNRLIAAIDPEQCDVAIKWALFHTDWMRSVRFPAGVAFTSDIADTTHQFHDLDLPARWLWSRELVARAKAAGIRGITALRPGGLASEVYDRF
jgi:hypothetical protein